MTKKYIVGWVDYENKTKVEEFIDVKEALQFIENGLHFIQEFTIRRE
jgi:hypothetical protein